MHSLNSFNDRRVEKRALKAANGPSKAPRGYKPDTSSREAVVKNSKLYFSEFDNSKGFDRKTAYSKAARFTSSWMKHSKDESSPVPPENKQSLTLITGKKAK